MEQDSSPSALCKMGCGFFGNQHLEGMCSKCHKASVQRKQMLPNTNSTTNTNNNNNNNNSNTTNNNNTSENNNNTNTTQSPTSQQQQSLQGKAPPKTESSGSQTLENNKELEDTPNKELILPSPSATLTPTQEGPPSEPATSENSDASASSSSPSKTKRNRCHSCRKRVGLTGCVCRCGEIFCGIHRYSDKHDCTFDYKTDGRKRLAQENPVVVGEKIKKL